jgi:hypothetical protein
VKTTPKEKLKQRCKSENMLNSRNEEKKTLKKTHDLFSFYDKPVTDLSSPKH